MSFWRRQFSSDPTPRQKVFDVIFGVFLPIVCFIADPIVFRSRAFGPPLPDSYALYAYLQPLLGILLLAATMLWHRPSRVLVGGLMAGAFFSLALGLRLLPLSFLGLFFVVGILGFTPFLSSFVFLRNGVRAWQPTGQPLAKAVAPAATTFFLIFAAPGMAQVGANALVKACISHVLSGQGTPATLLALRVLRLTHDIDPIVLGYTMEKDELSKTRIARAYEKITGRPITARLAELRD